MAGRVVSMFIALLLIGYLVSAFVRSAPAGAVIGASKELTLPGPLGSLTWPPDGEAAVGTEETGVLAVHGPEAETPLASVAKIMTAYVVLRDHPLTTTTTGPLITITATDVATYQRDVANGDSVVAVTAGEQLSELQALEALLVPSGDNIATVLADWDAGSVSAFVSRMNATAQQLGLHHTRYADASGVAPGTRSTAVDQLRLALRAMRLPAFAKVVDMAQVTLPVVGLQYNVDSQLGKNGIVGIKTGYTTTAGGCFVFAAPTTVSGSSVTVVGDVLDQLATRSHPSALTNAFSASQALLSSTTHDLERATVLGAGAVLGHVEVPWSTPIPLRAARSVNLTGLKGEPVDIAVTVPRTAVTRLSGRRQLGTASVHLAKVRGARVTHVALDLPRGVPPVSLGWRLTHPF